MKKTRGEKILRDSPFTSFYQRSEQRDQEDESEKDGTANQDSYDGLSNHLGMTTYNTTSTFRAHHTFDVLFNVFNVL
jgi:hypothetical protein